MLSIKFSKIASSKSEISITLDNYILFTLHRAENVDNQKSLSSIIKAMIDSNEKIIFPVHPRTLKQLHIFSLYEKIKNSGNIFILNNVGYFEMLELMKKCSIIVTDSGGLQEEATSPGIRKKVLVVRKSTDRPESVLSGLSELVGVDTVKIKSAIKRSMLNPRLVTKKTPFGKGDASEKIIKIMSNYF